MVGPLSLSVLLSILLLFQLFSIIINDDNDRQCYRKIVKFFNSTFFPIALFSDRAFRNRDINILIKYDIFIARYTGKQFANKAVVCELENFRQL